jgi:hypothetical protein
LQGAEKIIEKLGFEDNYRVEAEGRSRGFWLLWNKSRIDIIVIQYSRHLIQTLVGNIKGSPKKECFAEIRDMSTFISLPWMVVGDFNEVLIVDEKVRGVPADT